MFFNLISSRRSSSASGWVSAAKPQGHQCRRPWAVSLPGTVSNHLSREWHLQSLTWDLVATPSARTDRRLPSGRRWVQRAGPGLRLDLPTLTGRLGSGPQRESWEGCPRPTSPGKLDAAHQTVSDWHEKWTAGGAALKSAGRSGRLPKLSEADLDKVDKALRRGARANRYSTDPWNLARVAEAIEDETGVRYHPGHVWQVLRLMGWSRRRPARPPSATRSPSRRGSTSAGSGQEPQDAGTSWIVFQDERGFSLFPSVRSPGRHEARRRCCGTA